METSSLVSWCQNLTFFDVSLTPKHDTAYNTLFNKISLYKSPLSVDFVLGGDLFARFLGLENGRLIGSKGESYKSLTGAWGGLCAKNP